jgi:hypothetical protein
MPERKYFLSQGDAAGMLRPFFYGHEQAGLWLERPVL